MNASTNAPSSPEARRIALFVLLGGVVCMGMGQTIVFAVLPPLARRLGLADMQVLSIFMLSAVFWVLTGPIWGRRSDRHGRRPYIISGMSGFALSMIAFATAINVGLSGALSGMALYALLLFTRGIYGVVGSATPAAAQAYIADRTPPAERTAGMAAFSAAFGLGAMIGPVFAGAFAGVGLVAPLYGVAGLAIVAVLAATLFLPERTAPTERARPRKIAATDRRIRFFLIYALFTTITLSIPVQFTGFYMIDRLGVSDALALQYAGIALSSAATASLFAQLVLVQRLHLSPHTLLRAGPILVMLGHATIALANDIGPVAFGMMLSGLGAGLINPGVAGGASLAVAGDEQGAVAGLTNAAGTSGFIFAPLLGYALYSLNPAFIWVMTSVISAAMAAFAFSPLAQAGLEKKREPS